MNNTERPDYSLICIRLSFWLIKLYRFGRLRSYIVSLVKKLEGGDFYSSTLREIYSTYHQLHIGAYSYGCFNISAFPSGTSIGVYCSIADGVSCLRRNHPYDRLSQHPFFYNQYLGFVTKDTIEDNGDNPLTIGHDVWIGRNTTILPGCKYIGHGAIIGAGAIVTKDVPNFAIVGGNPAKIIKYRFSEEVQNTILKSPWWHLSIQQLMNSSFPYEQRAEVDMLKGWYDSLDAHKLNVINKRP